MLRDSTFFFLCDWTTIQTFISKTVKESLCRNFIVFYMSQRATSEVLWKISCATNSLLSLNLRISFMSFHLLNERNIYWKGAPWEPLFRKAPHKNSIDWTEFRQRDFFWTIYSLLKRDDGWMEVTASSRWPVRRVREGGWEGVENIETKEEQERVKRITDEGAQNSFFCGKVGRSEGLNTRLVSPFYHEPFSPLFLLKLTSSQSEVVEGPTDPVVALPYSYYVTGLRSVGETTWKER